jgi:hypothetical protein
MGKLLLKSLGWHLKIVRKKGTTHVKGTHRSPTARHR